MKLLQILLAWEISRGAQLKGIKPAVRCSRFTVLIL